MAAAFLQAQFGASDHVDGDMMLEHGDVRMRLDLGFQGGLDGMAGRVGGMDDAAMAVTAFPGQVVPDFAGLVAGERHALADEPFDGFTAVFDHQPVDVRIAQPRAGDLGVADMVFRGIVFRQHRGDPPLGPVGCSVQQFALGNDPNPAVVRQLQCHGQPGQAAAHDGYVEPLKEGAQCRKARQGCRSAAV